MPLPRMRGIKEAVEEIKMADPNTGITEYFLRRLVKSKSIPCVMVGTKYLVNMEVLEQYLQNPAQPQNELQSGIRRIAE